MPRFLFRRKKRRPPKVANIKGADTTAMQSKTEKIRGRRNNSVNSQTEEETVGEKSGAL